MKIKPRIDMIPLIDCVFLLLIFFMYSFISMSFHQGLPLDLPKAKTSKVYKDHIVQIDIKKGGKLFFDNSQVSYDGLRNSIKEKNKELKVFIRAEKEVAYDTLIRVMDLIREEEFSKVVLGAVKGDKRQETEKGV